MIRFEHVSFHYETLRTISDVSFTLPRGSFTAVIGSNGAGKSTISKLMRGLIHPTQGKIFVEEQDLSEIRPSALARKMGFLFQNPDRQICKNSVREELYFSLEHTVENSDTKEQYYKEVLRALNLQEDADPFLLSRGERQRVALASALVHQPDLLILDEPTTGLDYRECTEMMEYVRFLNEKGTTVVMVCHDMEVVLDYSSRVLVMNGGMLVAEGPTKEVLYRTEILEKASLLPPQMIELAIRLGQNEGIVTVSEMADYLEGKGRA